MSKKHAIFSRRILVNLDRKRTLKRLANVHVLYKDNHFFEYKVTFEGFPGGTCRFLKGAVLDSVKGVIKQGKSTPFRGFLEVGYHFNGKVFYKDVGGMGNFSKVIFPPVDQIKEPVLFLRIFGFSYNLLLLMNRPLAQGDKPLTLKNFSANGFITCDFYLSKNILADGKKYNLCPPQKRSKYANFQTFQFEDKDMDIALHLVFYKSDKKGIYILIPPRNFTSRIKSYFWYLYSLLSS